MPGNVLLTFEGPNYGELAHDALRLVSDRFLKIVRLKMKLFASGEVLGHLPLKRNDVAKHARRIVDARPRAARV